ncbi:MAG: hypothetical protein LBQ84_04620 [Flavobacteriaceae bacterium]|jgi:TPR repeat protein|nr:hypothetical protein [Flavobacteriaceae bacterium]
MLKSEVLKGDTEAYESLSSHYFKYSLDSLLPYSLMMSDKFDYPRAYYDVFELIYITGEGDCVDYNLICLNKEKRRLALEYLSKAIEKGDKTASRVLLDYYDKDSYYPIKELYENEELINKARENIK